MSNHAHRRRRPPRAARADITAAAALSSAIRGCTCDPDVTIRHTARGTVATIAHDSPCPAADTGRAIALIPTHPRRTR